MGAREILLERLRMIILVVWIHHQCIVLKLRLRKLQNDRVLIIRHLKNLTKVRLHPARATVAAVATRRGALAGAVWILRYTASKPHLRKILRRRIHRRPYNARRAAV